MKYSYLLLATISFVSCEEKEPKLVQSTAIPSLFLIKNVPQDEVLTKKIIQDFLLINHTENDYKMFYRYTSNTKSFLEDKRPGGYFREYLDHYSEDEIAVFSVSKCKEDTTKLVGQIYFFNSYGSPYEPDTLIYKCD